jgi:hypothetical protein
LHSEYDSGSRKEEIDFLDSKPPNSYFEMRRFEEQKPLVSFFSYFFCFIGKKV